ncbi:MAG TPA: ATPase, T2SS/T4P/T4SS family, partial [Coleofasciculaceae cyanobacterium]
MLDSQRHLSPPSPPRMPPVPPPGVTVESSRGSTAGTQQMASSLPTVASQVVAAPHQMAIASTTTAAISSKVASRPPSSITTCPLPPLPAPPAVSHRPGVPPTPVPALGYRERGAPTLTEIVRDAYEKGFSDVHLGVGETPRYRNRGEIEVTSWPETDRETFYHWMHEILSDDEIRRFENQLDYDGATQYEFTRVRVNIFDSLLGPAMVLRLIPIKIPTIEQLGLPPVFKDVCHYQKGLILVTGPTGSGKSTTLAAMIDYINKEMPKNIITIEDPIEFVHKSQKALIKHREVGIHTHKFDMALKAALREDPDVIL